jgi:hypothetical protein
VIFCHANASSGFSLSTNRCPLVVASAKLVVEPTT